jgi:large subunit ribosomal protein L29
MTPQEIRALSVDQLKEKVVSMLKEQMNLRFQKAIGQMEKPNRMREIRKDLARVKTEMTARANAASKE